MTLLALCSCGKNPEPEHEPVIPDEDALDTALLNEFISLVKGVWLAKDQGTYSFIEFSNESNGTSSFTAGTPETENIFGGAIEFITHSGGIYTVTVAIPAVEATEEYSGHEGYDLTVHVDTLALSEKIIKAEDWASTGKVCTFTYFSSSLDDADWSSLHSGGQEMEVLDEAVAAKLWEQLAGIWLVSEARDTVFFNTFTVSDGKYCITQGIPASGYAVNGYITSIRESGSSYEMTLFVPAVPESELDSGHDEYTAKLFCTPEANGSMKLTIFADNGDICSWRYCSADWDSFDWDQIYGVDAEAAWNMLSGVWVGKNESGNALYAYFYIDSSGERSVDLGVPLSDSHESGKMIQFEDRTSDQTWWVQLHESVSDQNTLIMIDYSAISQKKIRMTDFYGDGKVFTLELKASDPSSLSSDMIPG